MRASQQLRRGTAAIRLLAAALAGAIGAFGIPAAAARAQTTAPTATAIKPAPGASEVTPD